MMKHRTRIKICGITRLSDAQQAAALGTDAIGLVFHAPSPRSIEIDAALQIRCAMPPFVTVTALFMNENEDWVDQVLQKVRPDCLQFHGDEPAEFCTQWSRPYVKAIPMGSVEDIAAYAAQHPHAQGFLLDSNVAGRQGGSGDTFDWSKIPSSLDFPLLLAGGLNPENVAAAIARVSPWGVDVSSGVEKSRGIKDANLIDQFFSEVKRGDAVA
ncbi:MAG: phosphoribosylanthranilate isomerase [Proteobacteria bacterium]|nr:phosphoribosylanthranilate isomerase [Pseudomonadota bacterium]